MQEEFIKIRNAVAEIYGVSCMDINGHSHAQEIVWARHVLWYCMSKVLGMNYIAIAKFVKRNHSTVKVAIQKVKFDIETYPAKSRDVENLLQIFCNKNVGNSVDLPQSHVHLLYFDMICKSCQNDTLRVTRTERFNDYDIRHVFCDSCNVRYELITTIQSVLVYDKDIRQKRRVSLSEFLKVWLPRMNGERNAAD